MRFRAVRLAAMTLVATTALTAVAAVPVQAFSWSYSCQTAYRDFNFNGGGYSGWGLTVRVQTGGCWTSRNTTWLEGSQIVSVTRWWASDGSLYKDGLSVAPPPAQSFSSVTAKHHVSIWYTSPCTIGGGGLCIDYNAAWRMTSRVEIHNSSNPGVANWASSMTCSFYAGVSWVTTCSMSAGGWYKSGIVETYV